jgi:putative CocE/NonD family hydrolase
MTRTSRVLARMARLAPAETDDVAVDRDLRMLAEADITLLADHWYPVGADLTTVPLVLLRSPYGRRQLGPVGRLMAERGYQVVIQSCRGTFGSGGQWDAFRNEQADGRVTLDWLAEQPWWSGRMAMWGPSYLGLTQWAVAVDPPTSLKAIAPNVTASRFRDIVVYPGGSFSLETGATWLYLLAHQELGWRRVLRAQLAQRRHALRPAFTTLPLSAADSSVLGRPLNFYQDWLAHERHGDEWWDPVDFSQDLSPVPPANLVGGWYDIFLPAQIDDYAALRAAGREAQLTVGPWTHASSAGMAEALRDGLAWFDVHLRDQPERRRPWPVKLWVMGRDRWVGLRAWPPPAVIQRWHLHAGGRLDRDKPERAEADRYCFDPADPTPGIGGPSLNAANAGAKDQRARESRADVLTWTSRPLPADTTIAGPLTAEIWLRSSSEHTDLSVRLCRVDRRGRSLNLSDGILRIEPDGDGGICSAASPAWGEAARVCDGSIRVRLRMWPTAVRVGKGQRVRVQVAGGAHPLFARNPGGGERLGPGTRLVPVTHDILHDPDHPSGIDLPVSSI